MARDLHVVLLPWSAFGHIIPFFQLSIALAKSGVKVSFVSTSKNILRLPKVPPYLSTLINLVSLPLPSLHTEILPEGAEATVDVPFDKIPYLKVAYDLLQQPFRQLVAGQSPDWIIIDVIPHWAVDVAQELGVPLMVFSVFTSAFMVFLGPPEFLTGEGQQKLRSSPESLTSTPSWIDFKSLVAYKRHEAIGFHSGFYGESGSRPSDGAGFANILRSVKAMAIRSCFEFEGDYLRLHEKLLGIPVVPVGLLPPEKPENQETTTDGSWRKIFEWLDKQKPKSVVFVGFGSECKLSKDQVFEIANGLELCRLPFLWALRKPNWADEDDDALPLGFADRMLERGMVCMGWAPQADILGHQSIGGSLFHSGWGSVIETLEFGHCLVLLPLIIDQPLNARLLVEKGLAVEIEKREDGSFSRHDIAKALRLVMVSEKGERLRTRAKEAASLFGDRKLHQDHYIRAFVEFLNNGISTTK